MGEGTNVLGRRWTTTRVSPFLGSAFVFTIQPWVREAEKRLAAVGGCARFEMDVGYMVGPREVIFGVLEDFAKEIREGTGCELVARKCKMFSLEEDALGDCNRKGIIHQELEHIEESHLY
jgi:hypothetical protein